MVCYFLEWYFEIIFSRVWSGGQRKCIFRSSSEEAFVTVFETKSFGKLLSLLARQNIFILCQNSCRISIREKY